MHHVGKTAVHAFHCDNERMTAKEDEGVVGKGGRGIAHGGIATNGREQRVVDGGKFPFRGDDDKFGVEGGVKTAD